MKSRGHLLGISREEIQPVVPRRKCILHSREHHSLARHILVNALYTVDDPTLMVDHDEVGASSHYLAGKRNSHDIAEFVHALKVHKQNSFKTVLPYVDEFSVADMLS